MWKPSKFFTEDEVEAATTSKGGFSRASLEELGVPWPPPSGWRRAITQRSKNKACAVLDDPSKRTPEEWYALIPKLAHWAFK